MGRKNIENPRLGDGRVIRNEKIEYSNANLHSGGVNGCIGILQGWQSA